MVIGTDDIILSLREHILTADCQMKSGTAFVTQDLKAAFPDIVVLPRDLEYNAETKGPRIGLRVVNDFDVDTFYGDARVHRWDIFLEVDALMKPTPTSKVDADLSLRTMWLVHSSLRQLFAPGRNIPLHIWGQTIHIADAGSVSVAWEPSSQQIAEATFVFAVSLEKVIDL